MSRLVSHAFYYDFPSSVFSCSSLMSLLLGHGLNFLHQEVIVRVKKSFHRISQAFYTSAIRYLIEHSASPTSHPSLIVAPTKPTIFTTKIPCLIP